MGVFIRKAFKVGPVRFNLSKSGLGLSAGVKGLRLGAGPRGAYVMGGREGLYFRQSVGRSGKKNFAGKTQAASAAVDPVQSEQQSRAVRDDPTKPGTKGPFVPGMILAIIATLTMSTFWVVSSLTAIALAALVFTGARSTQQHCEDTTTYLLTFLSKKMLTAQLRFSSRRKRRSSALSIPKRPTRVSIEI